MRRFLYIFMTVMKNTQTTCTIAFIFNILSAYIANSSAVIAMVCYGSTLSIDMYDVTPLTRCSQQTSFQTLASTSCDPHDPI
jgi:hypothetical protein